MTITDQFLKARKVGVPLLGLETPDPFSTLLTLQQANGVNKYPAFSWDIVRGLLALNPLAEDWLRENMNDPDQRRALTANPTECLAVALTLPPRATLFFHNAHRYIESPEGIGPIQAVCNLRDAYKADGRMLILLAPIFRLPAELERDIVVLEQELSTDEERKEIVTQLYKDAQLETPNDSVLEKVVNATRGLAAFPTEQVAALSLDKTGIDTEQVWRLKRKMIEQTKGLRLIESQFTLGDIGGLARVKDFGKLLFAGNAAPTCIVFIDEGEKFFAGSSGNVGDSSGTSQDQLGVVLTDMENNNWNGQICVGPAGCAKSMYAQALGKTYGVVTIALDLGALKGSLVGQSETNMRQAMKTIKAIAGSQAFFVMTCNDVESLPAPLRRRFRRGVWYFDLPDEEEQNLIWKANLKRYGLSEKEERPSFTGFTGADIRNICENAWGMKLSLQEAATYITPVSKSDPSGIKKLRELASNRFLSASYEGFYQLDKTSGQPKRRIERDRA